MNLSLLNVELLTLGLALGLFLVDLLTPADRSRTGLGLLSALGYLAILVFSFVYPFAGQTGSTFGGMFLEDGFAHTFRQIFLGAAFLTALSSVDYLKVTKMHWQGEYYIILALVTSGMMFMASAGDFLSLYIALELTTIGFYVLTAMLKGISPFSSEAGLKYLLLGAFSSGVLLYGISLIYGLTGSTSFSALASWVAQQASPSAILMAAVVLMIAGLAFKITLVPFHMWAPDIYQGAPTPVTGLLSVGSKAAGFAAMVRVFLITLNYQPVARFWTFLLAALAALTFLVSNLIALKQQNIKRLLAYSSISQAGYLILGILANTALGKSALMFYLILYVFTNLAAFSVVILVAARTGSENVDDFKGLAQTHPLLALVMLLALLSLAGIPPLAGFFGKFYLFAAGIQAKWFGLVTWAVLNSIVSLFYYLVVVKKMYIEAPVSTAAANGTEASGFSLKLALSVCSIFILLMGVYPTPILGWLESVIK